MNYLWIAMGSALGGVARYGMSGWVARHWGETFPLGTLLVNLSGCFLIGVIACFAATESRVWLSAWQRDFLMLGVCGGYTTFSSFSLQTLNLLRDGDGFRAALNVLGSVLGCMIAVWLGYALAMIWNK
jgi:fluoride exporter